MFDFLHPLITNIVCLLRAQGKEFTEGLSEGFLKIKLLALVGSRVEESSLHV